MFTISIYIVTVTLDNDVLHLENMSLLEDGDFLTALTSCDAFDLTGIIVLSLHILFQILYFSLEMYV